MVHKKTLVTVVIGLLAIAMALPVGAQTARPRDFAPLSGTDGSFVPALADPDRLVTVMVEMAAEPVAVAQAEAADAGREMSRAERASLRGDIKASQDAIVDDIARLDGAVISQLQDAYNGIRVQIAAGALQDLASLAGVQAVKSLEQHRPSNVSSVPYLGAPEVWESLGYTGAGIKVGVIDTGIDYLHANFGGSGDPAEFAANDPAVVEPGTFPTVKVAGGYDFVGDAYDASSDDPAINTPVPDDDPLGCHTHGSHVAGSAAGQGVLADGTTFTGPYDATTHTNSFLVGPGVAPEADLYALKVFGCDGSTDVTVEAIDWAVANDLDVINMSLGSTFGRPGDPSTVASDNAASAGVVVVISAGNEGHRPYVMGSPGNSAFSITVGAEDTIATTPRALYRSTTVGDIEMQNSNEGPLPATGPVTVLEDDPATADVDESLGCLETDYAGVTAGDIVITDRGLCARVDRATHGQTVGAAAVVMINNESGFPPVEGPIPGVTIPFLGALQSDGAALRATAGETVTIEQGPPAPNPGFQAASTFTSAGPGFENAIAKPDVAAPGVSILSTAVGTGTDPIGSSGTSMSAPHVAGLAALVVQAHPDWLVRQVKAAIVNTADGTMVDYDVLLSGAGRVSATAALSTDVVAAGNFGTSSLSYGYVEGDGTKTRRLPITVYNDGSAPATYEVSVEAATTAGGAATVTTDPSSVTVAPGRQVKLTVTASVDLDVLPPGFQAVTGNVVLSPTSGATEDLRVPYVEVVKGTSQIRSKQLGRATDLATFESTNRQGATGTVDVYAWSLNDPFDASVATDVRQVGIQSFPDFDIGVFAIQIGDRISNPTVNEWDVLLDIDEDGVYDYGIVGFDLGALTTGSFNGQLASWMIDLTTGEIIGGFVAPDYLDSTVILLPFQLSAVGIDTSNPDFDFISAVFSLEGAETDVVDGVGSWNAFAPPIETGQFLELAAGDTAEWTAIYDAAAWAQYPQRGLMAVYAENATTGSRQVGLLSIKTARR